MTLPIAASSDTDSRRMGLALALGRRHLGQTWPNPSVGAVVAGTDGCILATASTARGGRPHAEPVALARAGEGARGATLYVSLEPCSHHGRTPPCAEAIVAAGIRRVLTAIEDPNPLVAGRGHAILRAAGIEVTTGVGADAARRDHRGHILRVREGRPVITVKLATTADGYASRLAGSRLMITGAAANDATHLLRARSDAILVGASTVAADDPRLDVRLPGMADRSPVCVVLDSGLRTDGAARLLADTDARPVWIVCTDTADAEAERRLAARGADVIRCPGGPDGRIVLPAALSRLAERGITRVLCEGGPALADALAAADMVDELVLVTAPTRLDGPGVQALGPRFRDMIGGRLRLAAESRLGEDLVQIYERGERCSPGS